MEALISSMMAWGALANRPPHILLLIETTPDPSMTDPSRTAFAAETPSMPARQSPPLR